MLMIQSRQLQWIMMAGWGILIILLSAPGLRTLYNIGLTSSPNFTDPEIVSLDVVWQEIEDLDRALNVAPYRRDLYTKKASLLLSTQEKLASKNPQDSKEILKEIRNTASTALKVAPGNSDLWLLLAGISSKINVVDRNSLKFLEQSYLTGPNEGWIAYRRLPLSLKLWPFLDDDLKHNVKREIRVLWTTLAFQNVFIQIFKNTSNFGKKVIAKELKSYGELEFEKFSKRLKRSGWQGHLIAYL